VSFAWCSVSPQFVSIVERDFTVSPRNSLTAERPRDFPSEGLLRKVVSVVDVVQGLDIRHPQPVFLKSHTHASPCRVLVRIPDPVELDAKDEPRKDPLGA